MDMWRTLHSHASLPHVGVPYPLVSAWILDKRALQQPEEGGGRGALVTRPSSKKAEAFIEQCRKDVQVGGRGGDGGGRCCGLG
jgi:hypothetical protein